PPLPAAPGSPAAPAAPPRPPVPPSPLAPNSTSCWPQAGTSRSVNARPAFSRVFILLRSAIKDDEVDDELDASVVVAASGRIIGVGRHRGGEAPGNEAIFLDAVGHQVVEDCFRALLGERLVAIVGTFGGRMALDLDPEVLVLFQGDHDLV